MDKEDIKGLIIMQGLTVMDVIDALAELNGKSGIALVSLGVDLKTYCVNKAKGELNTTNYRHLADLHSFPERKRIRMVVIDEHTLGYTEEGTNFANVLHASALKGATFTTHDGDRIYLAGRNVRTARWADFDAFNISSDGYRQGSAIHEYLIDP